MAKGSVAHILGMVLVPDMFHIRALKQYLHLCSEPQIHNGEMCFNIYHYSLTVKAYFTSDHLLIYYIRFKTSAFYLPIN